MTMKPSFNYIVQRNPRILSGVWFGTFPLAAMTLFMMVTELVTGQPSSSYLLFLCAIVVPPPLLALMMGSLTGPIILKISYGWTAVVGGFTGFSTFLLWMVLLEVLPMILGNVTEGGIGNGAGGDVPAAAEVVAYFVLLPLAGGLSIIFGAAAGILLHCTKPI
jgi:hypothetical protein